MLTNEFSKVLAEIEALNENEQNELAVFIHEELKWSSTFAKSQDLLTTLAANALDEHKKGLTKDIDCS